MVRGSQVASTATRRSSCGGRRATVLFVLIVVATTVTTPGRPAKATKVGQPRLLFDFEAVRAFSRDQRVRWTEGGTTFSTEGGHVETLSAAAWFLEALKALDDREVEALEALTTWHSAIERDRMFRAAVRGDLKTWPEDYPIARPKEARRRARRRRLALLSPEERARLPRPPRNRPISLIAPLYVSLERVGLSVPEIVVFCRAFGLLPVPPEVAARGETRQAETVARERYEVSIRASVQREIERARKRVRLPNRRMTGPSPMAAPSGVKLQSFTMAQELAAAAAAAENGTHFEHELLQRCTVEIGGKPFDRAVDRIDLYPPKVRVVLLSALSKISLPDQAATEAFLSSETVS